MGGGWASAAAGRRRSVRPGDLALPDSPKERLAILQILAQIRKVWSRADFQCSAACELSATRHMDRYSVQEADGQRKKAKRGRVMGVGTCGPSMCGQICIPPPGAYSHSFALKSVGYG